MIGGFIEVRGGGSLGGESITDPGADVSVEWTYGWIDWRFNPNVYLRVGRQTQAFAIMAPATTMGWNGRGGPHIIGINFGNVHGGSSRDAIRLYWKFNDMVRLELQAMDPDNDPNYVPGVTLQQPATLGGGTVTEENTIPRFDISLPITIGNFVIEPSGTWVQQKANAVEAGDDDSLDCYGIAVGIKAGFGPVILGGEFTWGQNLGNANYAGAANWGATAYDADGDGDADIVEDTDGYAWWFHLGFKLGPATIFGIVGENNTDNDGSPVAGDALEFDIDHWMYGVSVPISVAKGFTVRPEFMYYDYDSSAEVGGVTGVDRGDQWLLGVQFQLVF
jgi:hypothetical protein